MKRIFFWKYYDRSFRKEYQFSPEYSISNNMPHCPTSKTYEEGETRKRPLIISFSVDISCAVKENY